jgi:hypothetical protein
VTGKIDTLDVASASKSEKAAGQGAVFIANSSPALLDSRLTHDRRAGLFNGQIGPQCIKAIK